MEDEISGEAQYEVSYQGFSRSAMLVSIAILCTIKKDGHRMGFAVGSAVLIFMLGARSELYGFIGAVAMFECVRAINRPSVLMAMALAALFVAVAVVLNLDAIGSSRQLGVFNISADTSWAARESMVSGAWAQILEHPFAGVFAGHFYFGGQGAYAHNAISAWVSFGFAGFLAYAMLCAVAFFKSINGVMRRNPSDHWKLSFYLSASSLLLIVAAKPVFWPMPALAWGACVGASWRDRIQKRVGSHRAVPTPHDATAVQI